MQRRIAHALDVRWRSNDVKYKEDATFANFMLSKATLAGLQKSGFMKPSPVQLQAIPLGLCGFDLIVQAKSGTGKTCVFSVISLERISLDTGGLQVLILAPTREIAVQSCDVLNCIGSEFAKLACYAFIGGIPRKEDEKKLAKCHIAVGTPGRVKQLIELGVMKTSAVRLFVLDEADKLLQESFEQHVSWIYTTLPENKQVIALSATYPPDVSELLKKYLHNPYVVQLSADDLSLLGLIQFYKIVPLCHQPASMFRHKLQSAIEILRKVQFSQCLIFINSQARAKSLVDALRSKGLPADLLVGNQTQVERLTSLARLKGFRCRILVSTDLTARGVDAEQVNLVINFDMPWDVETYLHRTGRAGRYGTSGTCITFVTPGEELNLLRSMSEHAKLNISPFPDSFSLDLKMNGNDGSGDARPSDIVDGAGKDAEKDAVPNGELSFSVTSSEVQRRQPLFVNSKSLQDTTLEALRITPAKYITFDEAVKCCREYSDEKREIVPRGLWLDGIDVELYQSMNRLLSGWKAGFQQKLGSVKSRQKKPMVPMLCIEENVVMLRDGPYDLPAAESSREGDRSKQLEVLPPVLEQPSSDEPSSSESSYSEESGASSDSELSKGYSPDDTEEADSSSEDSDADDSGDGDEQDSEEERAEEAEQEVISVEPPRYHPAWGMLRQFPTADSWDEAPWCVCQACRSYGTRRATMGRSSATTWSCQVFSSYAYYIRQMLMRRSVYFNNTDGF